MALASALVSPARAEDFAEFSSEGLRGSQGLVLRLQHPVGWKKVVPDDEMALAELRGPQGRLTGILQIARGRKHADMEDRCHPARARTMLQNLPAEDRDARVTDVFARSIGGRPGYEIRYERNNAPDFLLVRTLVLCLKDTRAVVSCGATGQSKEALTAIEPVCSRVLGSLSITED